jgi:hypothetical protein
MNAGTPIDPEQDASPPGKSATIVASLRYGFLGTAVWLMVMAWAGIAAALSSGDAQDALKKNSQSFFTYWASADSKQKLYPPSPFQREDILQQKRKDFAKRVKEEQLQPRFDWRDFAAFAATPPVVYWLVLLPGFLLVRSASNRVPKSASIGLAVVAVIASAVGLAVLGVAADEFWNPSSAVSWLKCGMIMTGLIGAFLLGVLFFQSGEAAGRLMLAPVFLLAFLLLRYAYLILFRCLEMLG